MLWSGHPGPDATTQTLKGACDLLHDYKQNVVSRADYLSLLQTYTAHQRKNGRPYIAEPHILTPARGTATTATTPANIIPQRLHD